ncbi:TylF/MycF family methyltransferase [Streptomyces reniochalinae]|uniref:Macrocin O-methyltransferase n=1 Tax=Streptomyces reniochalinae TaxID=2250578 RepID=A0A367E6B8_9ACTN|nr:TylF/MycF family methyltransferase [Streptomyces reniochalinae]RCG13598.1 macrocin O-methyltransferase [Streptomyces reniochalinae]
MNDTSHYLELMKKVLTNVIYEDPPQGPWYAHESYDKDMRSQGQDWPSVAHTMVGLARLQNVRECLEQVLADGVPGDFIETGVWRGGTCIFARAVLQAHGVTDRTVWVADSFEGIPEVADDGHPVDHKMALHRHNGVLGISQEQVKANFRCYDLLDDQVTFLPGWFRDSLPDAPVEKLSVLRLDGDLYESTMDALTHLYPKLSTGGYVIIDDYAIPACKEAVHEYREKFGIEDELLFVDPGCAYWRRSG